MVEEIALSAMRLQGETCVIRTGAELRFSQNGTMDMGWIRDGLKKPGKTQRGLADALHTDPAAISRLLAGTRQLKASEIEPARAYLEGPADAGRSRQNPPALESNNVSLKVMGMAECGPDGWSLWNGDVIQTTPRPANLAGVPDAYAVYISGDSMVPRYHPGELAHIHPWKPVTVGSYVLVQKKPKAPGEAPQAVIKRLAKRSGSKIVLEQFNPPKLFEIKTEEIVSMHRVVGSGEA